MDSERNSLLSQTRCFLRRFDLKARKGLGQHFLIDEEILRVIVSAAGLGSEDTVIEVGPGSGVLTRELAEKAGQVFAVELDDKLAGILIEMMAQFKNVTIINEDILKLDLASLPGEKKDYKVVANLPYYITSPVLRRFLETSAKPKLMVVMVQKEVAEVIVAGPGQRSILSIGVQFYGEPEIVGYVSAESFYPAPEVDSAILKITPYPQPMVPAVDEEGFFKVVRAGFTASRKQLANSLARGLGVPKTEAMSLLEKAKIDPQRRAETLSIEEWVELWKVSSEVKVRMFEVLAPAKINLTLEVLRKRPDGFHEIRSVMQSISLYDSLRFQQHQDVIIKSDSPGWSAEESLVSRAVSLLQEATSCSQGVIIEVNKSVPMIAGLGGDSSDAAAVLKGLNRLWELNLSGEKLVELAAQLGSDVPFFLYGGTALAEGRGEIVTPLPPLPHMWVVLLVPDVPRLQGKTGRLYGSLNGSHFTDGQITGRLITELEEGKKPSVIFNTFENVAFDMFSNLNVYRGHLLKTGAGNVHLAGSGPALFSLVADRTEAEELYISCIQQGMEAYLAEMVEGKE